MNEHMISGANVALDLIKGWTDRQSYLLIVLLIKKPYLCWILLCRLEGGGFSVTEMILSIQIKIYEATSLYLRIYVCTY